MRPIRSDALAVAFVATMAVPAAGQTLADAAARLQADPRSGPALAACPTDLWRTGRSWFTDLFPRPEWTEEDCTDRPDLCAAACLDRFNGDACLRLGIVMEVDDAPDNDLAARRAHALACALGEAAGCTNRGGGIRNAPLDGDPLAGRFDTTTQDCLARTFAIACDQGDSWGCAMAGQAQEHGEGVAPDTAQARSLYRRACALAADPHFPACDFAQDRLETLGPSAD